MALQQLMRAKIFELSDHNFQSYKVYLALWSLYWPYTSNQQSLFSDGYEWKLTALAYLEKDIICFVKRTEYKENYIVIYEELTKIFFFDPHLLPNEWPLFFFDN